jgi:hypothetical protein
MSDARADPLTISLRLEQIRDKVEPLCHEAGRHLHAGSKNGCDRVPLSHLKALARMVACVDG